MYTQTQTHASGADPDILGTGTETCDFGKGRGTEKTSELSSTRRGIFAGCLLVNYFQNYQWNFLWPLSEIRTCTRNLYDHIYEHLDPVPHYTVFKRERYCFVPFSKWFASTLIVSVSFSPVHTTTRICIEDALQNLFSYILPPFFLHNFPRDKLILSHYAEVHPDLVQNHLGFGELRPSRFYYPRSAQSLQAKKLCNILLNALPWALETKSHSD